MKQSWRPCTVPGCPELTLNTRCEDHKYARPQGRRWARLRRAVLREFPECQLRFEGCTIWGTEVDHRVPLFVGGEPWAWDNLQSVCHECHTKKSNEER